VLILCLKPRITSFIRYGGQLTLIRLRSRYRLSGSILSHGAHIAGVNCTMIAAKPIVTILTPVGVITFLIAFSHATSATVMTNGNRTGNAS